MARHWSINPAVRATAAGLLMLAASTTASGAESRLDAPGSGNEPTSDVAPAPAPEPSDRCAARAAAWTQAATAGSSELRGAAVGDMAGLAIAEPRRRPPDLEIATANGGDVCLSDFRGRVVLVNFWASWCAPCLRELPSLERLRLALADEAFVVLAINIEDDAPDALLALLAARGVAWGGLVFYQDPRNRLRPALGLEAMPATLLIDRSGYEAARLEGAAEWDAPEAQLLIRRLLDTD